MNEKKVKKVLCIIDMQNDFLEGKLGSDHCRRTIPRVVELLKSEKWDKVFLTLDTHFDNYAESLEGKKLPVPHCMEHTWGHKICKEVADAVKELSHEDEIPTDENLYETIFKYTFGSETLCWNIRNMCESDPGSGHFFGEDLEIHMCGVCTSICVLANACILRAGLPNSKIVIHADACGDVNEEMHRHALECLKAQQCDVAGESDERIGPEVPYCQDENGEWVPAEPLKAKQE